MLKQYPLLTYDIVISRHYRLFGKNGFLSLCFILLGSSFSFAQINQQSTALSIGLRGTDYFSNYDGHSLTTAFQLNYYKPTSFDFLQIKFPLILGKATIMNNTDYTTQVSVQQSYYSLGTAVEMQIFKEKKKINPYLSLGGSYTHVGDGGNHLEIPFGTGFDIALSKYTEVQLNLEYRTTRADYRNNIGIFIGLKFDLDKKETHHDLLDGDIDGDGIVDLLDRCPDEKGVIFQFYIKITKLPIPIDIGIGSFFYFSRYIFQNKNENNENYRSFWNDFQQ